MAFLKRTSGLRWIAIVGLTSLIASCSTISSQNSCVRNEASESRSPLYYYEEPFFEDDFNSGFFTRTLRVESQPEPTAANPHSWMFSLHGTTEKSKGRISFLFMKPWALSEQIGNTFSLSKWRRFFQSCNSQGNEPVLIIEEVLRDEEGKLVLVSVGGPIDSEGRMHTAPDLTPEIRVSWSDVGCQTGNNLEGVPYTGKSTIVGIQVEELGGTQNSVVVKPGERDSITIQNREYVLAVSYAWLPITSSGAICGETKWTLYQKGFFKQDESVYP